MLDPVDIISSCLEDDKELKNLQSEIAHLTAAMSDVRRRSETYLREVCKSYAKQKGLAPGTTIVSADGARYILAEKDFGGRLSFTGSGMGPEIKGFVTLFVSVGGDTPFFLYTVFADHSEDLSPSTSKWAVAADMGVDAGIQPAVSA